MNVVHSIGLKDVLPFKEVRLDIKPGITVVYGLNRASGRASKNSNGVGKSYLLVTPAELLYEEPIVGERQDRSKKGTRTFSFTNAFGKKILVSRTAKGRGERLSIEVDGVDKQFRTPTYAKAYLKKVWPIDQSEYNTYVHIDSRVAHPLVMGTSAQRKAFFTSFFKLDTIDAERKLYVAELNRLLKIKAVFDELRSNYIKAKTDLLDDETYIAYRRKYKAYRLELRRIQDEFAAVQETARLVAFARSAKDQIAHLTRMCGGPLSEEEFERLEKANRWETQKVATDIEEAEAWAAYQRDSAHYEKAYAALTTGAKKYLKLNGRQALAKAKDTARLLSNYKEALRLRKAEVEQIEQELQEPGPAKVERPDGDEGELETLQRAYSHQLDHATQFQEGKCETCGQVVKIKDPKILRRKLNSVVARLEEFDAYREYRKAAADRHKLESKLKSCRSDMRRALDKVTSVRDEALLYQELKDLPTKPKPFKGKKLQLVVLRKMMEELTANRALLDFMLPHLDAIVGVQQLTKADLAAARSSDNLSDRMNQVQERMSKVQAKLALHDTMKDRVLEMRDRLVKMKRELQDIEPLKILVQGFQDKNLKKMAIEAIGQRLMTLVNKFAAPVFPEQFSFEFKWDTQIQLIVHRKNGESSDVRRLSGAESTLFTLILVGALLAFVPSHKRCSVMILDEPSARMSKETTELFQRVLQVLNKTIPSIIVITPRSDEIYEGARALTVVKDNKGVARLVEGFPHQVAVTH